MKRYRIWHLFALVALAALAIWLWQNTGVHFYHGHNQTTLLLWFRDGQPVTLIKWGEPPSIGSTAD